MMEPAGNTARQQDNVREIRVEEGRFIRLYLTVLGRDAIEVWKRKRRGEIEKEMSRRMLQESR